MVEVTNIESRKLRECRGNILFYIGIILLFISFIGLIGGENILIPLFVGITLVITGYVFMRRDYLAYLDLRKTGRVIYAKILDLKVGGSEIDILASYVDSEKSRQYIFKCNKWIFFSPVILSNLSQLEQIAVLVSQDYTRYSILVEETLQGMKELEQ